MYEFDRASENVLFHYNSTLYHDQVGQLVFNIFPAYPPCVRVNIGQMLSSVVVLCLG